jgi:hypothetical protein
MTLVRTGARPSSLTFNQDVTNCAVLATAGATGGQLDDGRATASSTGQREVTVKYDPGFRFGSG